MTIRRYIPHHDLLWTVPLLLVCVWWLLPVLGVA